MNASEVEFLFSSRKPVFLGTRRFRFQSEISWKTVTFAFIYLIFLCYCFVLFLFPCLADDPYSVLEAGGKLNNLKSMLFGITNREAGFQRILVEIIEKDGRTERFTYIDVVTICGINERENDSNLAKFKELAKKYNFTLKERKCVYRATKIKLLGYEVCKRKHIANNITKEIYCE